MSKERIRAQDFCPVKNKAIFEEMSSDLVLNQEQLAELASLYEGTFSTFQPGKLISGTVIKIDSEGVLIDIGYKSRGLINRHEFSETELEQLKPNESIEVMLDALENIDGTVVLSYEKAKSMRSWNKIISLFESNKPVEGIVTHKVKGGLNVDVGVPAFLPGSQIDLQRVIDFDQFVGQNITAIILKINKKRGNIIISCRKYYNEQKSVVRKKILDTLKPEQVIEGIVKNITNYGAFIDIGGVDGLLHITDMTWGRITHPSEMLKIGDTISVKVLSFDQASEKISLGLKQISKNPWEKIADQLKVGDKISGKIGSITDYGLFIEVDKEIEGLVHISEISWTDRINDLKDRYSVGQMIDAIIVSLDIANRRMSLSIKRLEKNPWKQVSEQFVIGQKIKGKITNITDFGVFVELLPGIDGLVHISDFSWTEHVQHPGDRYVIGNEIEAIILNIDADNKKVSLGIKQLSQDPWLGVEQEYTIGSIINGKISKIANFGTFVRLPTGIEGLLHNTTLIQDENKKAEQMFKVGDTRQFKVISINKEERKIGLSTNLESRSEKNANQNDSKTTDRDKIKSRDTSSNTYVKKQQSNEDSNAPKMKSAFQIALESAIAERKNNEGN